MGWHFTILSPEPKPIEKRKIMVNRKSEISAAPALIRQCRMT
jgi:hypothetical protein